VTTELKPQNHSRVTKGESELNVPINRSKFISVMSLSSQSLALVLTIKPEKPNTTPQKQKKKL